MIDTGIVYGRFQIMHMKHIEYILAAKMKCRHLYIGITMPDDLHISDGDVTNYRLKKSANPMTYIERYEMIKECILDFRVPREEFDIVPFPIERPEYLKQYVPDQAVCFVNIYDEWTEQNAKMLNHRGFQTEVLRRKDSSNKGVTGTQVRQRILAGEKWEQLVPRTVYQYVKEHGIDNRIKYTK